MLRTFVSLSIIASAACTDAPDYHMYEGTPDSFRTVSVWVDPHPELPAETIRQACETWRPEGVLCALAADRSEAQMLIEADEGPCEELPTGGYMLGNSTPGKIALQIACLHRFGGTPIREGLFWPVVSHEVGHQLGMWFHVASADGDALMNPFVHEDLMGMTVLDHAAYARRNVKGSVLTALPDEGCVLTTD